MQYFLVQCSELLSTGFPVWLSVMLAGLIGGLSHCSVMCAPLVSAQMLQLRDRHQPQTIMYYYHAGRITTYAMLGVVAVTMSQWVFSGSMRPYANLMLVAAGITFMVSAAQPRKTHHGGCQTVQNMQDRLSRFVPVRWGYYLRGLMMGAMPCGMLYAVLLLVATRDHVAEAALVMLAFGLTTVPILQLTGYGALRLSRNYPAISMRFGRGVMALNGLFLCGLGLNLVSVY